MHDILYKILTYLFDIWMAKLDQNFLLVVILTQLFLSILLLELKLFV